MSKELLQIGINGHVMIEDITPGDELGVILDEHNAIHPMNMSRAIARALANEPNSSVYKLALGNGGTFVDATGDVTFRIPHDGILPDTAQWQSRLYNQTYYEVVDDQSVRIGSGPGASIGNDGAGISGVRSLRLPTGESQVVVTMVINSKEPTSQISSSLTPSTINSDFVFDELGLFTAGLPQLATNGYQDVFVSSKVGTDSTFLPAGTYTFQVTVNNATRNVSIPVPSANPTYSALADILNDLTNPTSLASVGAVARVTTFDFNTYGALRLISMTTGDTSSVRIVVPTGTVPVDWLFTNLLQSAGGATSYTGLDAPVAGDSQGEEDNSLDPTRERERMLTHLIFHPLLKSSDRSWKITYKLTVVVQQSDRLS